jgi:hypothetical protein
LSAIGRKVALGHHAAHVLGGRGLQPDDVGAVEQLSERLVVRHDPAGGRDHGGVAFRNEARQAVALVAAERTLAINLEQRRDRRAVLALDHLVDLDEREAELLGEARAERRLAGAAQPDQRDAACAVHRSSARRLARPSRRHQVDRIEIERARDRIEHQHARIGFAQFDLRQVTLRCLALLRQCLARHGALGTLVAQARADVAQQRRVLGARRFLGFRRRRHCRRPSTRSSRTRNRPACCRCRPWGGEIQAANLPGSVSDFIRLAMKSPSWLDGSQSLLRFLPGRVIDQRAVGRRVHVLELADLAVERDVRAARACSRNRRA